MTTSQFFEIERIFELLDRTKKGFLDIHDIVEFMTSLNGGRILEHAEVVLRSERVMARMDIDRDGKIGIWDWKTSLLATKPSEVPEDNEIPTSQRVESDSHSNYQLRKESYSSHHTHVEQGGQNVAVQHTFETPHGKSQVHRHTN